MRSAYFISGAAVFDSSRINQASYEYQTYTQDFTDDGSVVTLTGTASVVDVHEIVVPDADADRTSKAAPATTDAKSAAPVSAADSGDVDSDDTSQRLRAAAMSASAALL